MAVLHSEWESYTWNHSHDIETGSRLLQTLQCISMATQKLQLTQAVFGSLSFSEHLWFCLRHLGSSICISMETLQSIGDYHLDKYLLDS